VRPERGIKRSVEASGSFGRHEPFTMGVEEELFLVDPSSGRLVNAAEEVLAELDDVGPGAVKSEVHACQVELITPVCHSADEALETLVRLRRAVLATGVGLVGSGTHPTADEGDARFTGKERYELIHDLLGDAIATPVAALHVHVGMPDAETAIHAFNGLRRHLPLLEALGANSPFRHGRDTGLASARQITLRAWPRSGVPRAMVDFDDFRSATERLTKVAGVPDYTFHWWKLRPHPRLGTVEIRALDVQCSLEHTGALVAAVQSLARCEAVSKGTDSPPPEILEEASFRAARSGVDARLPDSGDRLRSVDDLLGELLESARPHARELGCERRLDSLWGLLESGGGAGLQRAAYRRGGMEAVLSALIELASAATD
jgi:glutamate---cysteine ligase / carboxylate-amine ligase